MWGAILGAAKENALEVTVANQDTGVYTSKRMEKVLPFKANLEFQYFVALLRLPSDKIDVAVTVRYFEHKMLGRKQPSQDRSNDAAQEFLARVWQLAGAR